jgi:hypothetical protein
LWTWPASDYEDCAQLAASGGMTMLDAYCIDTITLVRSGGYDKWGEPKATTNVVFSGRVERKTKLIQNFKGEQAVSTAMIYIPGDIAVTQEDKLNFDGADHYILNILKIADFRNSHWEVYV